MKIPVTLSNRYAWLGNVSSEIYDALSTEWSFFAPAARWDRRYKLYLQLRIEAEKQAKKTGDTVDYKKLPGWDGRIKFLKGGRLPAGIFRASRRAVEEKLGIRFLVTREYPFTPILDLDASALPSGKHAFQAACVERMVGAVKRGGGTIVSATGSGKTAIAAFVFKRVTCACLFLVDQVELLYQSQKEIEAWLGEPVGVVGDQQYCVERVTAATVQTLKRHVNDPKFLKWYRKVKLVIVDELHVQMSRKNFDVLELIAPLARFGLTATLEMRKLHVRMNVWAFSGPVIFEFPIQQGIAAGVLMQGKALQLLFPETGDFDTQDYSDYQTAYEEEVVHNEAKQKACDLLVRELLQQGRYVIVLVTRVKHVELLHRMFHDIPHRRAFGGLGKDKRKLALEHFEAGKVKLIIANVVFAKGINVKRVDAIVDMAEMQSKNTVIQKYGRGVRLHEDKQELLYVDFGTQKGRFLKNARNRARALKAQGIEVKTALVENPQEAVEEVRKALGGVRGRGKAPKSILEPPRGQKTASESKWKQGRLPLGEAV